MVAAAAIRLYRLSAAAVETFSKRLPLELLAVLPRPAATRLWHFEPGTVRGPLAAHCRFNRSLPFLDLSLCERRATRQAIAAN